MPKGKFDSAADQFVYELSLDSSNVDHAIGDVQFGCWHGAIWFAPSDSQDLHDQHGKDAGYAIVTEDSVGFVTVDYFDHGKDYEEAWAAIQAHHADDDADDGEGWPNGQRLTR